MADWSASMQQTYEYYVVDPGTWKDEKLIDVVKTTTINRDSEVETLGSATIDVTESVGECYIRVYLITIQNGVKEKHPLGVFLVQTPASSFDGKIRNVSMDAYTPLLELKEKKPPIGYSIVKNTNSDNDEPIMDIAYRLIQENARAPVVAANCDTKLVNDFVADANDTWLSFANDLIGNAKYKLDLDEMGRILFVPEQKMDSLQPVWTYDDGNSSILYPEISMDHDLYGIPNVVEVIYSNGGKTIYSTPAVNDDENSPTSTVSRGRKIIHRVTDPGFVGIPTQQQVDEYAEQLLKELSTIEYTVTYTHGYCPVRLGDCVRLNYERAGIKDIKAKVIRQTIKCEPGCPVTEKAIFTTKLWR